MSAGASRASAAATADRVLDRIHDRVPGADVEVTAREGTSALTRFANGFIHQNVASERHEIDVRVALEGRTASAGLDAVATDAAIEQLVAGVVEAVRLSPLDPEWPGLAAAAPAIEVDHWDDATADAAPDVRAAHVAAFVEAAGGLSTAGACATDGLAVAFANSGGQRLAGGWTRASFDAIARTASSDASARSASTSVGDLDGAALGAAAAEKARSAAEPTDLEPGRYECVIEPQCVADLLGFLLRHGFNGRAVNDGTSFVRLGQPQFDDAVTLVDDVGHPRTLGVAFDDEGTPRRRMVLVDRGVTSGVLQSRRTAARAGTESTGHAGIVFGEPGAYGSNVVLEPGTGSTADLVAAMRRGLLVTDFWYTRILDPRTQVVTGLTRNGVWLVEDGRIVRPVRNLRFTQSYLEALAPGNVLGVGGDVALVPGTWDGSLLVPSLHLAAWNVTGNARG